MQAIADVLLVERKAIGCMPFEIVPYLFDGIEFGGISGKPLDV
jgi:hypothetical protein